MDCSGAIAEEQNVNRNLSKVYVDKVAGRYMAAFGSYSNTFGEDKLKDDD
jgi:hypothetical protein